MEIDKIENLPPPPGVIGSLKAGFDAIASNLPVILLPLALDVLLWLGPRMRVVRLFQQFIRQFIDFIFRNSNNDNLEAMDLSVFQNYSEQLLELFQQYNLLSFLRTFPIGIFSLMSGSMPGQTPFGTPAMVDVNSYLALLGWIIILTLIGWLCGGLYFRWVSLVVADPEQLTEKRFGQSILQTIFLSILCIVFVPMIGVPVLAVFLLVITASPLLAQAMLLVFGILSMWLIVPLFFTPHGIFVYQKNAFASIYTSLKMARFTLPTSSLFVLSVLLIAFGLNFIWKIPSSDSWMALVGITGHAFIMTSLLAASFIYYRDMQSWLQTVLDKLKTNIPTQQA